VDISKMSNFASHKASEVAEHGVVGASSHHVPVVSVEDRDPSLVGGFRVIYDRETPFELRIQDTDNTPQQVGTLEAIKVKILIKVYVLYNRCMNKLYYTCFILYYSIG
jgi:hypothetical protein